MTSFISDSSTSTTDSPLVSWRQLTLGLKANPKDLQRHTQRIMLAMDAHLQPFLPGALQDFFIVLEKTGRPLREKMFNLASPLLQNSDRAYFKKWLAQDSDASLTCQSFPGALLTSETCVAEEQVSVKEEIALLNAFLDENYSNSVDKAQYCVAYGCISHGQQLLETSLMSNRRHRKEEEQELLSIYYYSKNKLALDAMSNTLLKKDKALSEDWKKIQNISKEW